MSYLGINPADSAVINKREYIATAGQTTFPCLYDEYVEVYLNGSRLAADDFTATDGMNVVLTLAAEADDVIVCSGYENARFDNSVSTTGTDTISGVKTFTAQPVGIVKASVGLGNVDNTSDVNKPVSTATQTALNLKANQATTYTKAETDSKIVELAPMPDLSPYYTKTETDTAIANLVDAAPTTLNTLNELAAALGDDANFSTTVTNSIATKAPLNSPTFTGTVGGISAIMVGLGNVMNESKSTMFASPTFTGTVSGITSTMVGLGNVTNESKATMFTSPTFTGTVSGVTKTMVGLGSVDNTADSAKPVSTAQQTALNLKANLASPTFTGTVAGITKAMVGLGSVDNTSDASKPISTATQTALNLKANLTNADFSGNTSAMMAMTADNIPVGTSTTIPSGKQLVVDHLDVLGTLDVQGTLATTNGGYLSQTTMKTQAIAHTNGTNAINIDSVGNVGIGTSSPEGQIGIITGSRIAGAFSSTGNVPVLMINNSDTTGVHGTRIKYQQQNVGYWSAGTAPSGTHAFTIKDESNNTERMRIDSAGNLKFNSGYGSAATAYGCRAWVNFNGTGTVAIRASGNVSSITDNGTGAYAVNFTTAMPDVNYGINLTFQRAAANDFIQTFDGYANINSFPVEFFSNGVMTDSPKITATVFR